MQKTNQKRIIGIYVLIVSFALLKMLFAYSEITIFRKAFIVTELAIICCELWYLFTNVLTNKKLIINKFTILLVTLIVYEIVISYQRNLMIWPDAFMDIITWPLTMLVFYDYSRKNEIPKIFTNINFWTYMLFTVLSALLIVKHLSGNGNVGGVIFSVYYCLTFLPITLLTTKKKEYRKTILLLVFFIITISTKRGGLIAYVLGLVIYLIVNAHIQGDFYKKSKKYIRYIFFGIVSVGICFVIVNLFDIPIIKRFSDLTDDGGSGRKAIWECVLESFDNSSEEIKTWGHGFQSVYYNLKPFGSNRLAHNSYIEYLYDYGYVGLTLLLLLLICIVLETSKMIKEKDFNAPVIAYSIVIAIVFGYVSYFFEQSVIILPISVLWGIVLGENKRKNIEER